MSEDKQNKFLKMYEPVHERFERFCRARVYGDMEYTDLINSTLVAMYENLDALKEEKALLSYLCATSIHILANNHRKKKPDLESSTLKIEEANQFETSLSADVSFLYDAMREINPEQREAIILFEITGFSIKEIAEIQKFGSFNGKTTTQTQKRKAKTTLNF